MTRGESDKRNTKAVWLYDLRANMPAFGKTRLLTVEDFRAFEAAFGDDPTGRSFRTDEGEKGRFRCFSRADIEKRNDNLDIVWLHDDDGASEDTLTEPDDIAAAIIGHLKAALTELEAVSKELAGETTNTEIAKI
jgi:type I restriction enzyme M protein